MILLSEKFFNEVYNLSRLKEENTMNYFTIVLSFIRRNHNVTYDFDKIYEINAKVIDKNNSSPILKKYQFDYFEEDTLEHFMSTTQDSSIKSIQDERPEGRNLGISVQEQHLLIDFLDVYIILLHEIRKTGKDEKAVDFKCIEMSEEDIKKQKEELKDRINENPIRI